jgi:radical SAM protein with 4Fe4S-binding SPASM domain
MSQSLFQRLGLSQPGPAPGAPATGVHSFKRQREGERVHLHLRVDPDKSGLLVINAAQILHLNPTAVYMAWLYLNEIPEKDAIRQVEKAYSVDHTQAITDYNQLVHQIDSVLFPDGACPVCDLNLETRLPFSAQPSAPYRMDLAVTYRCNNNCSHCYNARSRNFPEMDTTSWKRVLEKIWNAGIPHVVFTGGEPTLRDDLPELIAYAGKLGMISGINTNGRRLKDKTFVEALIAAGLDHIQVTLESHDPAIHDRMVAAPGAWHDTTAGIRTILQYPQLYMMTNTTLLQVNSPYLMETMQFIHSLGVPTMGINALIYSGKGLTVNNGLPEEELPDLLTQAREFTLGSGQRLIWYTPTQYCHFNPVQLDLGVKGCTAALYNMCVEPDGSVLPCQSYYQSLGNILTEPWDSIWNHDLAVSLRTRRDVPDACKMCDLLHECGGGCPLAHEACKTVEPIPLQALQF